MKRKFAAIFATVLVMAMSATTVLAAPSVTLGDTVNTSVTGSSTENVTVAAFGTNVYGISVDDVKSVAAGEVPANATSAEIVGVAEVSYSGTIPAGGVAVTFNVTGINAGDNVKVLHYTSPTTCEVLSATAGNGTVTATFTSFSPVAIIKYTVPTTTTTPGSPDPGSYTADPTPVSPKTGVLPIAAMAAGICLAGAAVCGKKVKFN